MLCFEFCPRVLVCPHLQRAMMGLRCKKSDDRCSRRFHPRIIMIMMMTRLLAMLMTVTTKMVLVTMMIMITRMLIIIKVVIKPMFPGNEFMVDKNSDHQRGWGAK